MSDILLFYGKPQQPRREHILFDADCWCNPKTVVTDNGIELVCHADENGEYPGVDELERLRPDWEKPE